MKKTREPSGCGDAARSYRHPLVDAVNDFLVCLEEVADPAVRGVRWTCRKATLAGLLMALSSQGTLAGRCQEARWCLAHTAAYQGLPASYNGLVKALLRQHDTVMPVVKTALQDQVQKALDLLPKTCGFTLLAIDGSKADVPRTVSHEQHFGIADNGKCPQAFITAIVEVRTKLLWDWRIDAGKASEKHHLVAMACDLPESCLLLADGNFVGYGLWQALAQQGRSFLIRVGGNVHLLAKLWPQARIDKQAGRVYAWPKAQQRQGAPLVLRLIKIGKGEKAVYLLTNILDKKRLSDRAAGKIYRLRWAAETFYRSFKRTLGYVKLKSKAGKRGQVELNLALVACALMTLWGLTALKQAREDPTRISFAGVLKVVRQSLVQDRPCREGQAALEGPLATCLTDRYDRRGPKASRHRPKTKNTPKHHLLKPPKIRRATARERRLAREKYFHLAA